MDSNDILKRYNYIINNLDHASLEEVNGLLEWFNGPPVMIDGVPTYPFNDPMIASRLNARYSELTGKNNLNYLVQQEKVLKHLLSQKDVFIRNGVYKEEYFKDLETMLNILANRDRSLDDAIIFEPTAQPVTQPIESPTQEPVNQNMFQHQLTLQELAVQVQNMLQANSISTSEYAYVAKQTRNMAQTPDISQMPPVPPTQGMEM